MRQIPAWVPAVVAGLLLAVAGEGPDFGHYADWAAAALSGDVFQLRGNVLSPGGVPFSLAAPGPGLLFAAGKAVLFPLTLGSAALVTGWVATLVFWGSALVVLRRLADGYEWLALLGAGALFVGTHAGLYSHSYATEAFANALVAALWALALTREQWLPLDSAMVGALAGLLLLVRAHVVVYAVPALWLAVFGSVSPFATRGGPEAVGPPTDRGPSGGDSDTNGHCRRRVRDGEPMDDRVAVASAVRVRRRRVLLCRSQPP